MRAYVCILMYVVGIENRSGRLMPCVELTQMVIFYGHFPAPQRTQADTNKANAAHKSLPVYVRCRCAVVVCGVGYRILNLFSYNLCGIAA